MKKWQALAGLFCLAQFSMDGEAAELLTFEQPNLGIKWNAKPADLAARFPGLKQLSADTYSYRGVLTADKLSYNDKLLLLHFDRAGGLDQIYAAFSSSEAISLAQTLGKKLTDGRWAAAPDGNLFAQMFEWTLPESFVEYSYLADSAERLSKPAAAIGSGFQISRTRPRPSQLEAALAFAERLSALETKFKAAQSQIAAATPRTTGGDTAGAPAPLPSTRIDQWQPDLKKAGGTWGAIFNPKGDAPLDSFKVFYFNTTNPRTVISSELVSGVAINYPFDQFHNIKADEFGAYWVGRIKLKDPEVRVVNVAQSHAKTRVVIDGTIASESGDDATAGYYFARGEHLIEVEHVNNWHTTELRVGLGKQLLPFTKDQIRTELRRRGVVDADVYYVGLYDTKTKDMSVTLNIARLERDVVLVLSSYSATKWVISNPAHTKIKAVVSGNYHPGSEVVGVDERETVLLAHSGLIGSYDVAPRCTCVNAMYHCEGSDSLLSTRKTVEELTGNSMVGFSGTYSAEAVAIPDPTFTPESMEKARLKLEANEIGKQQCNRKSAPDFDRLIEK